MSDIRKAVKKYFYKSKNKEKYEKNQTLELRIQQGVAMEKGDVEEANRLKELVKEREQAYKAWVPTGSTDSWKDTLKKKEYFKSFIDTAEDIAGRKLVITTGGGSLNHRLAALDIGKSQLTDEQYDAIGKLAVDMGFRVGDEGDHLHIDDTIRKQEDKARQDTISWFEKNDPEALKDKEYIKSQQEKAIKARQSSKFRYGSEEDKKLYIPTSRIFYNPVSQAKVDAASDVIGPGQTQSPKQRLQQLKSIRDERKQKATFEKYMSTIVPVEEQVKKEYVDNRVKLRDLVEQQKKLQGGI